MLHVPVASIMNVTIRSARFKEQHAMASVCGKAWFDEDLFGRVMHPHRDQYPGDVNMFWLRKLREKWVDRNNEILVATVSDESETKNVVGVAVWKREGSGRRKVSRTSPYRILPYLSRLYNAVHAFFHPNRAADPALASILSDSFPYFSHHFTTPASRQERYFLDLLGVSPAYQGRGIGAKLVRWGIDAADREGICAAVIGSHGNDGFTSVLGLMRW
ncbi:uncharacterized protein BDZ99DRAFT_565105 [Mytilinidion resinicola]|uniref:N-acetyltransferase domain-containing protein n=1 Tax=Mytilinidion resinicola TaxID=574789 RepID=A0A6A6Z895_9PEZI|nr:uncharacterized protein BDZ99DRAFT_565105 [Mytilinidion resinicola]KAF2817341.1 hypothetical protein BDZ99DRAFT_565105 [Mytilinidion resinicola]